MALRLIWMNSMIAIPSKATVDFLIPALRLGARPQSTNLTHKHHRTTNRYPFLIDQKDLLPRSAHP